MPYTIEWLAKDRVIVGNFSGVLTMDEIGQFIDEQHAMIHEGTPPVHFINNSLDVEKTAFSAKGLSVFIRGLRRPEGFGWEVDVIDNSFQRMTAAIVVQLANAKGHQCDTMQEAVDFLQRVDPTLPEIVI